MNDQIENSIITACLCAAFIFLLFFTSRCQTEADKGEAATKQEAIRAGLEQGEGGRWVRRSAAAGAEAAP